MTKHIPTITKQLICIAACLLMISISLPVHTWAQAAEPTKDPVELAPNDPTAPRPSGSPTAAPTAAATSAPTSEPTTAPKETLPPTPEPTKQPAPTAGPTQVPTTQQKDLSATTGAPAVLAHGAAYVSGDDLIWQVSEVNVPAPASARGEVGDEAILFQRDGTTVVRNDATGKRDIMAPGEAYFRSAQDSYTIMSQGGSAKLWQFELSDPDVKAPNAFYASPVIKNVHEGSYDLRVTRYVLNANDKVDLPENTGAGLVMVSQGQAEVSTGNQRSALSTSDGQSIGKTATISNTSQQPAVVLYVSLGQQVDDQSAGVAQGSAGAVNASASPAAANTAGTGNTAGSGTESSNTSSSSNSSTLQGSTNVPQDTQNAAPGQGDPSNGGVTSINVTATADIYLTITVDGTTIFDGPLPAGASSGPVVGSHFEVTTSSGTNTTFTNACGSTFKMGDEEGQASYVLTYDPATSCAPR